MCNPILHESVGNCVKYFIAAGGVHGHDGTQQQDIDYRPSNKESTMTFRDYYALLGIACDASLDTILHAYRIRAFERHPDRNAGDPCAEADMRLINEAITVLRDATRRRAYDASLQQAVRCDWMAGDVEYSISI